MKKIMSTVLLLAIMLMVIAPTFALAQDATAAQPAVEAVAEAAAPVAEVVAEVGLGVLFQQAAKAVSDWKSLGWQLGLAALITLLISSMKNSMLRGWIWDKIPNWLKLFMAPLLSILAFALMSGNFSAATLAAAITTGVGSQYLHEMLDALKGAPFVGEKWSWLVDAIGSILKAPPKKV